jgi:hypothetical protein
VSDSRFAFDDPSGDRDALCGALAHVHAAGHAMLLALPLSAFHAAQGDRWSPATHVRHLTRSTAPLITAFRLPPWVLRLRFGRARRASRDYTTLVADYRAALAAGGQAGRFAPPADDASAASAERRTAILQGWHRAVRGVEAAVRAWDAVALDRVQLPHPLLGPLTAREMLAFTVYHTAHHLRLVEARGGLMEGVGGR